MKATALLTITFLFSVLCLVGIVAAKEYEVNKKVGEYGVLIKIDRNPPIAGKNNVEISITDASGKAVTDAKVALSYSMPPMAGMAPMNYKADAELKGNAYRVIVNYSMAGSWNNDIRITRAGKTTSVKFTIDAK
ncbi:MAG: copper resistance protein [Deltaproteobacteria bacterium]|nr:copper resistance protein [Deltaproteobacteria bacterium]